MSTSLNGVPRAMTNLGSFLGRTYDPSLLQVLGVPDVDGKDLTTLLITDRLDDATIGLSQIASDVVGLAGAAMVGTNGAALASVLGALDTAAAAGAVTTEDAVMAYVKQLVTNSEAIAVDVAGLNGDAMVGTDNAALASVAGALDTAANTGEVDTGTTLMGYVKQLVDELTGAAGVDVWAGGAAPANTVSIHEVIEQIYDDVTLVLADTGTAGVVLGTKAAAYKTLAGENQIAITTEDLNQIAGSYDLFLGTTKPCLLKSFSIKQPTTVTAGALTSISIVTDDATPGVIISVADGDVANLLTESELSWTGAMRIETGTKIILTIAGGATGVAQSCKIAAEYIAIEDTGSLEAQE